MKALCVQSPHHLVIEERPLPEIQEAISKTYYLQNTIMTIEI